MPSWLGLRTTEQRSAALGIGSSADDLRTGWYQNQPALHPAEVSGPAFQQLFDVALDGSIYAQPLLFPGGLLIATENNHIYVLDPATGATLDDRTLEPPWHAADLGCGDLVPNVGITGTPVIDPASGTAYLTTKTYASGTSGPAALWFHALALPSLGEQPGFPVAIQGPADNQTDVTFDPTHQLQRTGLVLLGGTVYAGFGSHCGITPYKGWIIGVSTSGQIEAHWSTEDRFNDGGGIWQAGGAPLSDGPNTFIVSTGNGESPPAPSPGNAPPNVLGESWVRLTVQSDNTLLATDFFTPANAAILNAGDADFGAGGPVGLPDALGTASVPHAGIGVGKQGYVFLLNRDNLGGFQQGPGGSDQAVQRIGPIGGVWSRSAVWPGEGGWTYLPTSSPGNYASGTTGQLNVFSVGRDGAGNPALSLQAVADGPFGFGTSPPIVTSDGTSPGTALVWIVWSPDGTGVGAELRAYDTLPIVGTLPVRLQLPVGTASKFNPPGVGDGRIYVGNRDGHVLGFGNTAPVGLGGPAVSFGPVTVGTAASAPFQLTAARGVTVTALGSTSAEFAASNVTPPLPATLAPGGTLSGTVTFQPATTGLRTGALVATAGGSYALGLSGTGQVSGANVKASPASVTFEPTALGEVSIHAVTFSNVGDTAFPIDSASVGGPPFSVSGGPSSGFSLAPGQSVTITVTFAPAAGLTTQGSLTLSSSAGAVVVPLSGAGVAPGQLVVSPLELDFGVVRIGDSQTQSFHVANTGGQRLTLTRSKPPASGVGFSGTPLPEGTSLAPGESMAVNVTFAPTSVGDHMDQWSLNSDVAGADGGQNVVLKGTGVGTPTDGGMATDGGTGGGASSSGGCTAAAGTSLWPLVLLVGWLARPRRRNPAATRPLERKPEESRA
jgi:iron transport multicopper oxidase